MVGTYVGNTKSYLELAKRSHRALVLHRKAGVGKSYSAMKVAEEIFGIDGVLKITVTDKGRLWFPSMSVKPKAKCLIIDEFHWGRISADLFKAILMPGVPLSGGMSRGSGFLLRTMTMPSIGMTTTRLCSGGLGALTIARWPQGWTRQGHGASLRTGSVMP